MSSASIYGFDLQFVQQMNVIVQDSLILNTTKLFIPIVVPVGFGRIRIVKVLWTASASLVQAAGTSTVAIQAGQPGSLATIVAAASVLGGVANTPAEFTLAAETAAKELTLLEGGIVVVTLAVSNNALGTNGSLGISLWYHGIPRESAGSDVKHAAFYTQL